jgi:hypothetical protein
MSFIGGIAQGVGAVAGAAIQASAQNKATEAQEREANATLNFNQQVYGDQKTAIAPYQEAGKNALGNLVSGVGTLDPNSLTNANFTSNAGTVPTFSSNTPQISPDFSFTANDLQNDPGYQFTLDQGMKANERAASALGVSGGAAKSLAQYTTGLASTHFNDAYNRALSTRQTNLANQNQNFNQDSVAFSNRLGGQQQQFNQDFSTYGANTANTNQNFNHLATLAGVGQTATAQAANAGTQAANNFANASSAAANAQSAGAIATGNSIASGIQGATNSLANYLNYQAVFGKKN